MSARVLALGCLLLAALTAARPARAQAPADEEEPGRVSLREYDLGFATEPLPPERPRMCLASGLVRGQVATSGGGFSFESEPEPPGYPAESLLLLLDELLAAEGWEGSAEIAADERTVRVVADAAGQRRFAELVDAVAAQLTREVQVTVRVLACPELPVPLRGQPCGRSLPPAASEALTVALARGEVAVLQELRLSARDGLPARVVAVDEQSWLGDVEVNQTGVIPVLMPVVLPLREGSMLDVTATSRGPDAVQVDLRLEVGLEAGEPGSLELPSSAVLLQPSFLHLRLAASAVLRPGQPAIVGLVRSRRAAGPAEAPLLLVTAEVERGPARAAAPLRGDLPVVRFHPLAGLTGRGPELAFDDGWEELSQPAPQGMLHFEGDEEHDHDDPGVVEDELMRILEARGWTGWDDPAARLEVSDGHLIVVAQPADHAPLEEALAALRAAAPPPLAFEVHLLRLPAAALAAGQVLDRPALAALLGQARAEERLALPALGRQMVQLDLFRERPYLHGYERSAGGSSEAVGVVDDPIVGLLAGGARARLRGEALGDGAVEVEADLLVQAQGVVEPVQTAWGPLQTVSGRERLIAARRVVVPSGGGVVLLAAGSGAERRALVVSATRLDRADD